MKKLTNILTIIALIVIVVLIGTISFGYYKKVTMEVKNPIGSKRLWNNKIRIISRNGSRYSC